MNDGEHNDRAAIEVAYQDVFFDPVKEQVWRKFRFETENRRIFSEPIKGCGYAVEILGGGLCAPFADRVSVDRAKVRERTLRQDDRGRRSSLAATQSDDFFSN